MNRTERAIKKQYREAQLTLKNKKKQAVLKLRQTVDAPNALIIFKGKVAAEVRDCLQKEKEARKQTIEYKCRTINSQEEVKA